MNVFSKSKSPCFDNRLSSKGIPWRKRPPKTRDQKIKDFWSSVSIKSNEECWEWLGSLQTMGYGQFCIGRKCLLAHRFSWFISNGEIPKGLFVCHRCDNPKCVNPKHLFLGTPLDNMTDKIIKGRIAPYAPERAGRVKLSWDKVNSIRQATGNSTSIAKLFNVSRDTIRLIQRNKIWRIE